MNPRHILILKGSPRKRGNSATLADRVAVGASEAGAAVESFDLHGMEIRPCDGCGFCQGSGECVINDDMQTLYPRLREADAIVIASPIYWFTVSAQVKACIDRWYALEGGEGATPGEGALAGKEFGIVLTYGDSDPYSSGAINAIRMFQDIARYEKASIAGLVYGSASDPGEIASQAELMQQAHALGQRLAKGA
jgi:multimeric flavodoxin WrbA